MLTTRLERFNLFILNNPILSYFFGFLLVNILFTSNVFCEDLSTTGTPSESFPNKKKIIVSLTVLALIGVCVIGYYFQIETDPINPITDPTLISKLTPEILTELALRPVIKTMAIVNAPNLEPYTIDPSFIAPLLVAPAVMGILHIFGPIPSDPLDPAQVFDSITQVFQKFDITFINPQHEYIGYESIHPGLIDVLDAGYTKGLSDTNSTITFQFLTNSHVIEILKNFQLYVIMDDTRTACTIPRTMFVALLDAGFSESDIYTFIKSIHSQDPIDLFIHPLRKHLELLHN